jgi:hypothetical protein
MLARRLLELLDRCDLQVVVNHPGRGGADAWYAQQREESGRDRGLQLLVALRPPGRDDLLDGFADRRADLRDLFEATLLDELREGLAKVADRARRGAVGDCSEDVLALELDEIADLVEDLRDGVVARGEGVEGHPSMLGRGVVQDPGREAAGSRASSRYANADSRSPRARSFCAYSAASVERSGWSSIEARSSIALR